MDFLELAKSRYSVRAYLKKAVEIEKLDFVLEAGRVAPTGANRQPQRILVIQNEEGMKKLHTVASTFGAPVALIVCCDKNAVWMRPNDQKKLTDIDVSIITDHMMLAAASVGLGSLWLSYFEPEEIIRQFNIPENYEPVNILLLGYADHDIEPALSPDRHQKLRKPIVETVFYNNF